MKLADYIQDGSMVVNRVKTLLRRHIPAGNRASRLNSEKVFLT